MPIINVEVMEIRDEREIQKTNKRKTNNHRKGEEE